MIQINLLPDLKKEFVKAQKTKAFVVSIAIMVSLGAIGLSILLFVYVTFVQQLQIKVASDDIKSKMNQLKAVPDIDKYLTVQNQLNGISALHEQKGSYSRLLDFLVILNPKDPNNVSLADLKLDTSQKSIVLTGTTKTFEALNVFVDTLKNADISYKANGQGDFLTQKMFDQVLVQSAALAKQSNKVAVGFTLHLTFNENVFNVKNTEVSVKVPAITTTPSVNQSPAVQLFNSQEAK